MVASFGARGSALIEKTFLRLRVVDQDHRIAADAVRREVGRRASTAWPATAASKALPPACRMRRAASVASGFIDVTAACRPRMTGRIVADGRRVVVLRVDWCADENQRGSDQDISHRTP